MGIVIKKTRNIDWEGLNITVYFAGKLNDEESILFKDLVNSWYTIGQYKGFGGSLHNISQIWIEEAEAGFTVDMGSVKESSLAVLFCAIEGLAEIHGILVEKVIIGAE